MLTERKQGPDFILRHKKEFEALSTQDEDTAWLSLFPMHHHKLVSCSFSSLSLSNSSTLLSIYSGSRCLMGVSSLNPWPGRVIPLLRVSSASWLNLSSEGHGTPSASCGTSSEGLPWPLACSMVFFHFLHKTFACWVFFISLLHELIL